MDKLDKQIIESRKELTPGQDFVDQTMRKINEASKSRSKRSWFKPLMFSSMAFALLLVVAVAVFGGNIGTGTKSSDTASVTRTSSQKPAVAPKTASVSTANQLASAQVSRDIAQLDQEVSSGYVASSDDIYVDDLGQ